MNLRPPPESNNLEDIIQWCKELYDFLQLPEFDAIRLVPRATLSNTAEGNVYYDSDDDKLKCRDASIWNDCY